MRKANELCPHMLKLHGDAFGESCTPRCNTVPIPSTKTMTLAAKIELCKGFFPIPRLLETTNLQQRSIQMSL